MNSVLDRLRRALDYQFRNPELLECALTHRSVGGRNNERLEFLGDAVLSFVITDTLYHRFPQADEGSLSRLRASLVKGENLARMARALDLGDCLNLGPGELKSGGFRRDSILADALEAVFGAVYLDAGTEAARALILRLYQEQLDMAKPSERLKDAKTRLQEYLQARQLSLPSYKVNTITGEAHNQTFSVECCIEDPACCVRGKGSSRRKAEQAAAEAALEKISQDG